MNSFTRSITVSVLMVLVLAFISFGYGSSGGRGLAIPSNQVAEPSVDRPAGYFVDPIDVIISPGTAGIVGDTIEFTTDGSDPSCGSGTAYSSTTVTISATTTIKGVACKDGIDDSDILEATYSQLIPDTRVNSTMAGTPINRAIRTANIGDIIYIEPGMYTEIIGQVVIDKPITLIGVGTGADSTTNRIISDAPSGQKPIYIPASRSLAFLSLSVIENRQLSGGS